MPGLDENLQQPAFDDSLDRSLFKAIDEIYKSQGDATSYQTPQEIVEHLVLDYPRRFADAFERLLMSRGVGKDAYLSQDELLQELGVDVQELPEVTSEQVVQQYLQLAESLRQFSILEPQINDYADDLAGIALAAKDANAELAYRKEVSSALYFIGIYLEVEITMLDYIKQVAIAANNLDPSFDLDTKFEDIILKTLDTDSEASVNLSAKLMQLGVYSRNLISQTKWAMGQEGIGEILTSWHVNVAAHDAEKKWRRSQYLGLPMGLDALIPMRSLGLGEVGDEDHRTVVDTTLRTYLAEMLNIISYFSLILKSEFNISSRESEFENTFTPTQASYLQEDVESYLNPNLFVDVRTLALNSVNDLLSLSMEGKVRISEVKMQDVPEANTELVPDEGFVKYSDLILEVETKRNDVIVPGKAEELAEKKADILRMQNEIAAEEENNLRNQQSVIVDIWHGAEFDDRQYQTVRVTNVTTLEHALELIKKLSIYKVNVNDPAFMSNAKDGAKLVALGARELGDAGLTYRLSLREDGLVTVEAFIYTAKDNIFTIKDGATVSGEGV